jgi:hypothetical protein
MVAECSLKYRIRMYPTYDDAAYQQAQHDR